MSCNSCAKGYSFLRPEKGCPCCGFSFCSKCLNNKLFIPKLNTEAKVCLKCKRKSEEKINNDNKIIPPDAYYKRLATTQNKSSESQANTSCTNIEDEIQSRLNKLKESNHIKVSTEEEIARRLQGIKGETPTTSDAELHSRLARLKGIPDVVDSKPVLPMKDLRTEQEQADDLMKQYLEQTQIDSKYQDEFDNLISDMETRMKKLKGANNPSAGMSDIAGVQSKEPRDDVDSEDEDESVRKIVEKLKAEALAEDEIGLSTHDELPFCEICNEDAKMRCLGCQYLFCKRCFRDHKDDHDGCDRYEPYQPPKGIQN